MVAKCLFCALQHVILLFMDKIDCYTFISLLSHVLHLPPSSLSPPSAGTLDYVTEVERVDETDDNIVTPDNKTDVGIDLIFIIHH